MEDPEGERKMNFLKGVAARFRNRKTRLVRRFIRRKNAPKKGNPNSDRKPWEIYEGQFTEEDWRSFEAYVATEKFMVIILNLHHLFVVN